MQGSKVNEITAVTFFCACRKAKRIKKSRTQNVTGRKGYRYDYHEQYGKFMCV